MKTLINSKMDFHLDKKESFFVQNLKTWYSHHVRSFPWVGEKDPYKVWLSEIILQQTRVEQGLPYYLNILKHFPDVASLAQGEEQFVFRLWQGLGYYNRCKNMLKTAGIIHEHYQDRFPADYGQLLSLPGIGPYTAAAIASFAFNLPHAVVDGNVERLLSRYFGKTEAVNSPSGKKAFTQLANKLLDKERPDIYNQAIMDFGATVCLPQNPRCTVCPFRENCVAYQEGIIDRLPVKIKKQRVKERYFYYFVLQYEDLYFIKKRQSGDIWENLYDFILYEAPQNHIPEKIARIPLYQDLVQQKIILKAEKAVLKTHILTHQKLHIRFIPIVLSKKPQLPDDFLQVKAEDLKAFPFPRPIVLFLSEHIPEFSQF